MAPAAALPPPMCNAAAACQPWPNTTCAGAAAPRSWRGSLADVATLAVLDVAVAAVVNYHGGRLRVGLLADTIE